MATKAVNIIKNQIIAKLNAMDGIQEVHAYATVNFNGYPAAVVSFDNIESDYETTKENLRFYNFTVHLYQESEKINRRKAEILLQELMEEVVDAFEGDEFFQTIGISMPSGKVMLGVRPSTSPIQEEEKYIRADVTLPIRVSFDITI